MKKILKMSLSIASKINCTNSNVLRVFNNAMHFPIINGRILIKGIKLNNNLNIKIFNVKNCNNDVIIYLHGGGWMHGNSFSYYNLCSKLSIKTKSIVIFPEYSLAPEHQFPKGLDDCLFILKKLFSGDLDIKFNKVILMGDSAGGNLAAVLSLICRNTNIKIDKQILLYPCLNNDYSLNTKYKSVLKYGKDYGLTRKKIEYYLNCYIKSKTDLYDFRVAPLLCEDLSNLPPTLMISAQYDPLIDENLDYSKKLMQSKNKVISITISDVPHGFFNYKIFNNKINNAYKFILEFLNK